MKTAKEPTDVIKSRVLPPLSPPQSLVQKRANTMEGRTLKKKNSGTWNPTPVVTCILMGVVEDSVDVNWAVVSFIVNLEGDSVKLENTLTILMTLCAWSNLAADVERLQLVYKSTVFV